MARMYPNELIYHDKLSSAEIYLYQQFQKQLDDSYTVFHSVAWQSIGRNNRMQDGEADFVIAHPDNGILVIEVKGGTIEYDPYGASWMSRTTNGKKFNIKDPFMQAKLGKYSLIDVLKTILHRVSHINIGHAVAFPDVYVGSKVLGLDKPRDIILDMSDAANLSTWVGQAMAYWRGSDTRKNTAPTRRVVSAVMQLLGKNRELRPVLWGEILQEQTNMLQLTEEQFSLLDVLNKQKRVAVSGCAGSGKTMLAVEKAVRLQKQGLRVLLTCYNKNLSTFLSEKVGNRPNLDIVHFHKLCFDMANRAKMLPIQSADKNAFYNHQLPEALLDATDQLNERYDAIIVDEGQDFKDAWWVPLQNLLHDPEESLLYIFFDDNQRIYSGGPSSIETHDSFPIKTPPFALTINCRNTRQIHKQVSRFYRNINVTTARGPLGRPVSVARYEDAKNMHAALTDTIRHLTHNERIPAHEITILTPLSRSKSNLWLVDGIRGIRYTEQWPAAPEQIHCNTIHAFKGLESTVVILAETERWSNRTKDLDPLLYVACSRAKNHLIVLLPDNASPVIQRRFA